MKSGSSAKRDDVVEARGDLLARQAERGGVDLDALAAGHVGLEAGAEREQRRDASAHRDVPLGRVGGAGDEAQQRRLAGAVLPDDADGLAAVDVEADVAQRPEVALALARAGQALDDVAQQERLLLEAAERLADLVEADDQLAGRRRALLVERAAWRGSNIVEHHALVVAENQPADAEHQRGRHRPCPAQVSVDGSVPSMMQPRSAIRIDGHGLQWSSVWYGCGHERRWDR